MCLVLNFNLKLSSVCFIYRICAQLSTAIYSMTLSNFQEKTRATSALFSCQALTKSASLQPSYSKEQSFDTIVTSSAFNIFAKKKKNHDIMIDFRKCLKMSTNPNTQKNIGPIWSQIEQVTNHTLIYLFIYLFSAFAYVEFD